MLHKNILEPKNDAPGNVCEELEIMQTIYSQNDLLSKTRVSFSWACVPPLLLKSMHVHPEEPGCDLLGF